MIERILRSCFYILFFLTPLIFTPWNHELFEYNKMMLVYALTVIIVGCWVLKMIQAKSLLIKRTPLDIPLLLFLLANIASTVTSIDVHTSIWGYYSRSNGGLLSILSYVALFYALVSNFEAVQAIKFLRAALWGGLLVSLYAIPEHFGISPSCIVLVHSFSADCWVQDVQARVFATLGQPNWLAAYLGMLIFPTLYFLIEAKTRGAKIGYFLMALAYYLAFTFAYSRGASLGLLAGFGVLIVLGAIKWQFSKKTKELVKIFRSHVSVLISIIVMFLLISLLFGSALNNFKLLNKFAPPPRPALSLGSGTSQIESGGTESGQIRLIVWKGAVEIFKHYPIFGSGLETFAYSYYQYRPVEHNMVSEWDFLYNKAHNEFLNYLATTGLFGFATYLLLIGWFVVWTVWLVLKNSKEIRIRFLAITILASYISYLVQNFFGFSVVIIALFFYVFPALTFLETDSTTPLNTKKLPGVFASLGKWLYRRPAYPQIFKVAVVIIIAFYLLKLSIFWFADTLFAKGENYSDAGNAGRAYNYLSDASDLNSGEPLYRSELSYAAAAAAVALSDQDATTSASLKGLAALENDRVLSTDPRNVSFWRTSIRTLYQLSAIDPSYNQKTLDAMDQAIMLAPTDAKLYYNKALILSQMSKNDEAVEVLKKCLQLKPNYREAYLTLGVIYGQLNQKELASEQFNRVLQMIPNDPEALQHLQDLKTKK